MLKRFGLVSLGIAVALCCSNKESKKKPASPEPAKLEPTPTPVPSAQASEANSNSVKDNTSRTCQHVYEEKPGSYAVLVVDDSVVWINDTLREVNFTPVGGGDVTTFQVSDVGSVWEAIVVGSDIVVSDPENHAMHRISLAARKSMTLVEKIHHPYHLAHASGFYFIGEEDEFLRFDPVSKDLTTLHAGMADQITTKGDTVYVVLDEQLLAINARTGKQTVLIDSLPDVDDSEVQPIALAAIDGGVVWSTAAGAIWTHQSDTRSSRKLVQLEEPAVRILPIGSDLYFATGANVQRLRGGHLKTIPIDKSGWEDSDDPRIRIVDIAVHGDALIYYAPFTAFASTCLD